MAHDFGVDFRSTPQRVGQLLQNQKHRSFSQHKSISLPIKWPHGLAGSLFCSDIVRMRQKPMCSISIMASDPPAIATSTSSSWIIRLA
jgi:hypothetical protein